MTSIKPREGFGVTKESMEMVEKWGRKLEYKNLDGTMRHILELIAYGYVVHVNR